MTLSLVSACLLPSCASAQSRIACFPIGWLTVTCVWRVCSVLTLSSTGCSVCTVVFNCREALPFANELNAMQTSAVLRLHTRGLFRLFHAAWRGVEIIEMLNSFSVCSFLAVLFRANLKTKGVITRVEAMLLMNCIEATQKLCLIRFDWKCSFAQFHISSAFSEWKEHRIVFETMLWEIPLVAGLT